MDPIESPVASNKTPDKKKQHYELVTKAQAITMRVEGVKWEIIEQKTGISRRAVYRILHEARRRGFDPENNVPLLTEHLKEKPRPGRPRKLNAEEELKLMEEVSGQKGKTAREVAAPLSVSRRTIQRAFKRHNTTFEAHRSGEKEETQQIEEPQTSLPVPSPIQHLDAPHELSEPLEYRDLSAILSPQLEKQSIYPSPYVQPPGPYGFG